MVKNATQSNDRKPRHKSAAQSLSEESQTPLTVAIVDDDAAARHGMRRWIEEVAPAYLVCAEFGSVAEAEAQMHRYRPWVVVINPYADGGAGRELIRRWRKQPGGPECLARVHADDDRAGLAALEAGARAVVSSEDGGQDFLEALRRTGRGEHHISPRAASKLGEAINKGGLPEGLKKVAKLSRREDQVFQLFGEVDYAAGVARRLGISAKTVSTHQRRIREKLGLSTNQQLIDAARTQGGVKGARSAGGGRRGRARDAGAHGSQQEVERGGAGQGGTDSSCR